MSIYKPFAKQALQYGFEKELRKIAEETINEGYGLMTGSILIMNFSKMQELAIEQFRKQKNELGLTEQEIIESIKESVKKITAEYIK